MKTTGNRKIGVLFQATMPPEIDEISKPMKPGGYSDSSADVAYNLYRAGYEVALPVENPDPRKEFEWCFPDTLTGIRSALDRGAECIWANTVLYADHPICQDFGRHFFVVGQRPRIVDRFDNKFRTNCLLRDKGLSVTPSLLAGFNKLSISVVNLESHGAIVLARQNLGFPMVVKPVRGRGSEGVAVVHDFQALYDHAKYLTQQGFEVDGHFRLKYGPRVMIENYLNGEEVTVTVMPPGTYQTNEGGSENRSFFTLPPVFREGHCQGIAPYNGAVAVTKNSRLATEAERRDPELTRLRRECERAAEIISAIQPIRVDARKGASGLFEIFDVNLKPNLTGAGRPGRDDQDGLMLMAARGIGWSFVDLLANMARSAKPQKELL